MLMPFIREAGTGPNVLCLHSSASTSGQWRGLIERLSATHRVIATDSLGDGKSPPLRTDRTFTLEHELELLEPLTRTLESFDLVGHSLGGEVAMLLALTFASKVRSLTLYEPTLWGTLQRYWPNEPGTQEILAVRDSLLQHVAAGRLDAAGERFIDYWTSPGSWAATPAERLPAMRAACQAAAAKWALRPGYPFSPEQIVRLPSKLLLLTGSRTTEAARSACKHLLEIRPDAMTRTIEGAGHMGPITHAADVNAVIADYLQNRT